MGKVLKSPHKVFFYLGILSFVTLVVTKRIINPEIVDILWRVVLASLATSGVSRFIFGSDPLVGEDS